MPSQVSVIIPTYNRLELLPRAIESVLGQTYSNFECFVVDDASPENTREIVKGYDDDRLEYIEHHQNRGASAARNTGIEQAKGNYIAFLDDDDEWQPEKLEKQVALLKRQPPEVGLVYCWMDFYDSTGELYREYHPTLSGYVFPEVLDGQRIGGCPTLLVRRSVVEEVDGFDESLPRGNDGDFIRRVCHTYEVDYIPEALVNVYIDHGHDRISQYDESGIRNAINGHKSKLDKFGSELDLYPERAANIYAQIAYHYSQLGEFQKSVEYYKLAVQSSPTGLGVYRKILWSLKEAVF